MSADIVDLCDIIEERNKTLDDLWLDSIVNDIIDTFCQTYDFTECDEYILRTFSKDLSVVKDAIQSAIYRLDGKDHPMQDIIDDIIFLDEDELDETTEYILNYDDE